MIESNLTDITILKSPWRMDVFWHPFVKRFIFKGLWIETVKIANAIVRFVSWLYYPIDNCKVSGLEAGEQCLWELLHFLWTILYVLVFQLHIFFSTHSKQSLVDLYMFLIFDATVCTLCFPCTLRMQSLLQSQVKLIDGHDFQLGQTVNRTSGTSAGW